MRDRAYLEIDLEHLAHNAEVLKEAMPARCELMAVVKAQAYGHGAYAVAAHVNQRGVRAFAVATIEEGIALRRQGIFGEILILGYTDPARAEEIQKYDLTQTLVDAAYAEALNKEKQRVKTHIKVDTGMHRMGFDVREERQIVRVLEMRYLRVCGIYTHLCAADSMEETDRLFTGTQIACFYELLERLKRRGISIPKVHVQSSYGLLNYPELKCDYVRVGIALYGVLSSPSDQTRLRLDLRPVLSFKAKITLVREIKKGDSMGYGRAFAADRDSRIAFLPVGYADGYPRSLSCGKAYVLVGGRRAPIAGKICMDQLAVDVTDIPDVKTGMTATLIGKDGEEEITAAMAADWAETITNELLSRMGRRLPAVVRQQTEAEEKESR